MPGRQFWHAMRLSKNFRSIGIFFLNKKNHEMFFLRKSGKSSTRKNMRFLVDFCRDHTPFSGHWHVIMMIFDVSENVRIIMFLVSLVFCRRGLRFFIVRLSVCLFVCCHAQIWSKTEHANPPVQKEHWIFLNKKRFRFRTRADKSIQWRRLRHSRCCWWVITRFESRLHHRTQRGHPCPAGVI